MQRRDRQSNTQNPRYVYDDSDSDSVTSSPPGRSRGRTLREQQRVSEVPRGVWITQRQYDDMHAKIRGLEAENKALKEGSRKLECESAKLKVDLSCERYDIKIW
jgi:hypothetical protein